MVGAAPSLAPSTLQQLLQAAGNSESYVRKAAVSVLGQLAAAPSLAPSTLQPLLTAAEESDPYVRNAAVKALGQLSLAQLIEGYLATRDKRLIPVIVTQLLHTPLVILSSRTGYQHLVLYPTAGEPVMLGEWSQAEVQQFVKLLKIHLG